MENVEAKAYLDEETNDIYELYTIFDGNKVAFNLDGIPFKFENFILVMVRQEETIKTLVIHIPALSQEGLKQLNTYLELPTEIDRNDIEEMGDSLVVRFELKEEAITKFINPKFSTIRNLKQFFMMRDDLGGSVILDFYYYNISLIEPTPLPLPEDELTESSV